MATKTKERQLKIVIKAKDSFSSTFTKASSLAKSTASVITKSFKTATVAVAGIGAAVLATQGAIVALASSVAGADDKIGKLALRIGASTEALSEYQHVAELSGITAQTLGTAWQRQARRISQAAQGTGEAKKALEELNLSARDMSKLAPEDQFEMIADAMLDVSNQGDKMRIAMQIWDTEGVSLLQTMEGGSAALRSMRDEARLLGLSMSGEQAKQAAEYNDAMTRLQATFRGLKRTIIIEVLPQLTQSFIDIKNKITEFLPTIKRVISTAITVVLNFPTAMGLFGTAIKKIYAEIITDTADVSEGFTELFIEAFSKLGPAIGKIMVRTASIIWIPISAAFDVTLANINAKYFSFLLKFRITSREFGRDMAAAFGASTKELGRLQKGIDDLKSKLKPITFGEALTAATASIEGAFDGISGELSDVSEGFRELGMLINLAFEQGAKSPALVELLKKLDELKVKTNRINEPILASGGAQAQAKTPETASIKAGFAPELDLENELMDFFDRLEQDALSRDEFKRNLALSFFDFETDLAMRKIKLQEESTRKGIELSNKELETFAFNAIKRGEAQTLASGVTGAANKAMENQMLSLVETGKFSAQEFANVVAQQVKVELIGISARAAVQAIFQTALGFGAAATGNEASAALHFSSAGQFASIAGVALASAAAVNQANGGTSGNTPQIGSNSPSGGTTAAPIGTTTEQTQSTQLTININNPIGNEDWDKIVREEIVPAINRGGNDNVTINSTVIRAV